MKKIFILLIPLLFLFTITSFAYTLPESDRHWAVYQNDTTGKQYYIICNSDNAILQVFPDGNGVPIILSEGQEISYFSRYMWSTLVWSISTGVNNVNLTGYTILDSNYNIYTTTGELYFDAGIDMGQNLNGNLKIILPWVSNIPGSYYASETNLIKFTVSFTDIPFDGNMSNLVINSIGLRTDQPRTSKILNYAVNQSNNTISGTFSYSGYIKYNVKTKVMFEMVDYNFDNYFASVYCLSDEGYFDPQSTSQPTFNGSSGTGEGTGIPTSLNPLDWLKWLSGQITSLFTSLASLFTSLSLFVVNFVKFLGSVIGFLPPEFLTLLLFGLSMVIVLRIFKR